MHPSWWSTFVPALALLVSAGAAGWITTEAADSPVRQLYGPVVRYVGAVGRGDVAAAVDWHVPLPPPASREHAIWRMAQVRGRVGVLGEIRLEGPDRAEVTVLWHRDDGTQLQDVQVWIRTPRGWRLAVPEGDR